MIKLSLIGAPTDIGAGARGASMGPGATLDSIAHLRSVAPLSDLGTLRIDLLRRQALLDAAAAAQHGLSPASAQGMTLES